MRLLANRAKAATTKLLAFRIFRTPHSNLQETERERERVVSLGHRASR